MKVILIKDCKDGKENDVIEVNNGYGTNFLIKNGYALPYNKKTSYILEKKIENKENEIQAKKDHYLKLKEMIEGIELSYSLKFTNNVANESITRKQIVKDLKERNIPIDTLQVENVKINTPGLQTIKINFEYNIFSNLKIRILKNEKK